MMGNVGTSREIVGYIHICIGKHWDILGLQKNIIGIYQWNTLGYSDKYSQQS